jgi:hypothetical protein
MANKKQGIPPQKMLERRVQKTLTYLKSERGQKNWSLNIGRKYTTDMNLIAAVQTATRLIKYEKIIEVINVVRGEWAPARGWAA